MVVPVGPELSSNFMCCSDYIEMLTSWQGGSPELQQSPWPAGTPYPVTLRQVLFVRKLFFILLKKDDA